MTDNVNAPSYYVMPDGTETISLTRWLTSNGGQAVQYIARATRSDGVFKGSRVEDLRKSIVFIQNEIDRLSLPVSIPSVREPRVWEYLRHVPIVKTVVDDEGLMWRHYAVDGWVSCPEGDKPPVRYSDSLAFADLRGPYTEVVSKPSPRVWRDFCNVPYNVRVVDENEVEWRYEHKIGWRTVGDVVEDPLYCPDGPFTEVL